MILYNIFALVLVLCCSTILGFLHNAIDLQTHSMRKNTQKIKKQRWKETSEWR